MLNPAFLALFWAGLGALGLLGAALVMVAVWRDERSNPQCQARRQALAAEARRAVRCTAAQAPLAWRDLPRPGWHP